MASVVDKLTQKQLIRPPSFLKSNIHYEVVMGSIAYGVATDYSDFDVYGFCVPPKQIVFPHLGGVIPGFGNQGQKFEQYQQHHILDEDAMGGKGRNYDLSVYNIVKYFQLCADNNPNMLDTLYVKREHILSITSIGEMVRENRDLFPSKKAFHRFRGYAFSQLHKMNKEGAEGKRKEIREKYGYDVKFGYHLFRLLNECRQLLETGNMDLQDGREYMKAIRRGEVKQEELVQRFNTEEKELEKLYHSSSLRHSPDEPAIKQLLLNCLEHAYGSLDNCIVQEGKSEAALRKIREILEKTGF